MLTPQDRIQRRILKNFSILRSKIAKGEFQLSKKIKLQIIEIQLESKLN